MKKKIIGMVLSAIMVFGVFGCFAACKKDERTELRIISWDFGTEKQNNLNRRMVKAFEEKYTDYRVTIESPGANYTETVQSLAGQKKLPDVLMIDNLPTALVNDYLYDLTEKTKADPDWAKIPAPVLAATEFNGRTFAVPAGMHLWGVFVNDKVFKDQNKDTLPVNCTVEDFKKAVSGLNMPQDKIASLDTELEMINWLPVALSEGELGYYTWDGDKFNLDSQAFSDTLSYMKTIRTNMQTYDSWTPDMKEAAGRASTDEMWYNNQLAMYYAGTHKRSGMLYGEGTELLFQGEMRYIGTPGGINVIVPDIWGVNSATAHPEMAYELAKWMSFSPEGILKRLALDETNIAGGGKQEFISLPLSNDKTVVDEYFENETIVGLRQVFESLDTGVVEGVKIIPGYNGCRWTFNTGLTYEYTDRVTGEKGNRQNATIEQLFDDIWKSQADQQWANLKTDLNKKINDAQVIASRALNNKYPKA